MFFFCKTDTFSEQSYGSRGLHQAGARHHPFPEHEHVLFSESCAIMFPYVSLIPDVSRCSSAGATPLPVCPSKPVPCRFEHIPSQSLGHKECLSVIANQYPGSKPIFLYHQSLLGQLSLKPKLMPTISMMDAGHNFGKNRNPCMGIPGK